jgi:Flp pilus assembly pilin Flp
MFKREDKEKGATLVEFALLFGLIVMIALGTFEYGMVFRDSLSVSVAAREGARVAASAANYGDADCVILEATSGALQSLQSGEITEVHIYRSNANGDHPGDSSSFTRRYRPADPSDPDLVACSSTLWQALQLGSDWDPDDRINTGLLADWIGVRIEFDHEWLTNFLWWSGTASFADDAVFRMEPPAP